MEMEKRLYEATIEGKVSTLKTLIQEDPLILDRISLTYFFHETPLHISISRGHLEFTRAVLSHNPKLATESDSLGHTPLHLASTKGFLEIVTELVLVSPVSSCLARSKDGKLPLHLAIMKGVRVDVVSELARACPESTRLRLDRGQTILHLCVKYNNLEALQVLMENHDSDLLNARDEDGNTVFHLASLYKHLEIIKYLLTRPGIELNALNNIGFTSLDLVENSPRDFKGLEVLNFLLESNVQRGRENPSKKTSLSTITPSNNANPQPTPKAKSWKRFFTFNNSNNNQLEHIRGELFITAAIITAVTAFPVINMKVNGSNSQVDYSLSSLSFMPAMAIMVLLVSGFSLKNKLCIWLVVQLMYTSLGFLGLNYIGSIISDENYSNLTVTLILMYILFGLLLMVSVLNIIRLVVWVVKSINGRMKRRKMRVRRENVLSNA